MCALNSEHLLQVSPYLIQQVFIEPHAPFFSFTETEEEISIVLAESYLTQLPQLRPCVESWHGFTCLTSDTGIDDIGILLSVSKPFKEVSVSVFILSTYRAVNVLVEESKYDLTKKSLSKSKQITLMSH